MPTDFAERRWASSDGLSLFARDYSGASGTARLPLICLHGLTRNSRDFEDVAPRLATSGRRVIVPDVRGRGLSDRSSDPSDYHPKIYARDVREMMRALGIAEAVFLGTSMGGIITMTLAAFDSRAVAAAILNDVGPQIAPEGVARLMSYVGKPAQIGDWDEAADYCRRTNECAFPHFGAADWDRLARRTFRDDAGLPVLDYDPSILKPLLAKQPPGQAMLAWFLFRKLARKRPVLLLRGALSDVVTEPIAEQMMKKAPRLTVAQIPGVGHAPMLTEPKSIEAIDQFLNSFR